VHFHRPSRHAFIPGAQEAPVKSARYWAVVVLLAGTALLLLARGNSDLIPASDPISQMPLAIAGWSGSDLAIDQETLDVLGAGTFLSRAYAQSGETQPIDLFIAYFPTQRTGVAIHSPKNCLPGSGWAFESSQYVSLNDANGKARQVGEYVIGNGENRQFVIYWYQAHGRSIANEYLAKVYLVVDAIRLNRTDGALVRVTTPIEAGEVTSVARARAEAFTAQLVPMLPRFIPN
jgi:EpsI family protein